MKYLASMRPLHVLPILLLAGCAATPATPPALAQTNPPAPAKVGDTRANEGGDLAFGGPGTQAGKFLELRDMTFDSKGNLYALDGAAINNATKQFEGNLRVQKFDNNGKLLQTFDLKSAPDIEWKDDSKRADYAVLPMRVAADGAGEIFVSVPGANKVLKWGADGKFARAIEVPRAMAITVVGQGDKERIAVVPSFREVVDKKGWTWTNGDKIVVLTTAGEIEKTIDLPQNYENAGDLTADKNGDFFLKAEPNAIYKFSPDGKLLKTYGGNNTGKRPEDGSELIHTVAVDSKGNVYGFTWGNGAKIVRYDADGKTLEKREGQFKWADSYSTHSGYAILAVDPSDRLWGGVTKRYAPDFVWYEKSRSVPAIVRTKTDYFKTPSLPVTQIPVRQIGFRPDLSSGLLYNISYETKTPVEMNFSVGAANRFIDKATVNWHAFDAQKNEVDKGTFSLPLVNGEEAKTTFSWTPPRYGAYFVMADISAADGSLGALGEHIAVTPRYANMMTLADGDRKGGWSDSASQMWAGLPGLRLHPGLSDATTPEAKTKKLDELDAQITAGEKAGATILIQLVDSQKKFDADDVKLIVNRFKGRIKYVEVVNEPNFSGSIEDYFKIHKEAYGIIKAIDPSVIVMGPGVVNINLDWAKKLYELGFKDVSDAITFHDYEGHESISQEHWQYKYSELRKIMAQYGDADKPIWQTERAISGVRGQNFQGLVQAIRLGTHLDLMESLGIPNEHDFHYYLNQGGYSSVPSYVWSAQGPMPAAVLTRTRYALTSAMKRKYAGTLDFGNDGNDLFMGVRYQGNDGETVALRNLGTVDTPLEFNVAGAQSLDVADAWGNASSVPVNNGKATLTLRQLPIYVRLPAGATLTATKMNLGRDLAARAKFDYSSVTKSDYSLLNNGVIETYHSGNPNGDTNGQKIWQGELPRTDGKVIPQTLDISFDHPQLINKVLLRGIRGDNGFSALLNYDLQYDDGGNWKTVATVDNEMPRSETVATADAEGAIWMDDTNFYLHQFAPVTTSRLRLVVKDASRGFIPDERARAWSSIIGPKLMLREVEVFAPSFPVSVAPVAAAPGDDKTVAFTVTNNGKTPFSGQLKAFAPANWTVSSAATSLAIAPGKSQVVKLQVGAPAARLAGTSWTDVELRDSKGALTGTAFAPIEIAAPLQIDPMTPGAAQNGAQLLQANVKNTTDAPLSGVARASLSGAREIAPVEVNFGPIAPGQTARVDFPIPGADASKERFRASYEIVANGVITRAQQDLVRQNWQIVGPFAREFNTEFGPEKKVDFAQTFTDMMGTEKKWTAIAPDGNGYVNLNDKISPNQEASAYAATIVNSPVAQTAIFSVGTDDGGRGWVNGQEVYTDDASHDAKPGAQRIPVELKAGRNVILIKIMQSDKNWGFYFDLLDPQSGKPLDDVVYSTTP